jgi:hypothetical protein
MERSEIQGSVTDYLAAPGLLRFLKSSRGYAFVSAIELAQ